jgi:hypothetical protein
MCLLDVLKNNFFDVDDAMFEGVEMPYEIIFFILLDMLKNGWLNRFVKISKVHSNSFFASWASKKAT